MGFFGKRDKNERVLSSFLFHLTDSALAAYLPMPYNRIAIFSVSSSAVVIGVIAVYNIVKTKLAQQFAILAEE